MPSSPSSETPRTGGQHPNCTLRVALKAQPCAQFLRAWKLVNTDLHHRNQRQVLGKVIPALKSFCCRRMPIPYANSLRNRGQRVPEFLLACGVQALSPENLPMYLQMHLSAGAFVGERTHRKAPSTGPPRHTTRAPGGRAAGFETEPHLITRTGAPFPESCREFGPCFPSSHSRRFLGQLRPAAAPAHTWALDFTSLTVVFPLGLRAEVGVGGKSPRGKPRAT